MKYNYLINAEDGEIIYITADYFMAQGGSVSFIKVEKDEPDKVISTYRNIRYMDDLGSLDQKRRNNHGGSIL